MIVGPVECETVDPNNCWGRSTYKQAVLGHSSWWQSASPEHQHAEVAPQATRLNEHTFQHSPGYEGREMR
jgi:hypothetical protein